MITVTNSEGAKAAARNRTAGWLKQVRQMHLYLGVFFAPSILFFAFSGSLQLFNLHEGHPGEQYQPPAWIEKLASIHKDQRLAERHGPPPPAVQGQQRRAPEFHPNPEAHQESKATLALKCFFLAMATGLFFTTLLGLYMAFKYQRSRTLTWITLLAGVAIPATLIAALT
jgi:hypothetical protein